MAMTVIPYKEKTVDSDEATVEFLKRIGLIDVEVGFTSSNIGRVCRFKFPDGTPVNKAILSENDYRYFIMYDFEEHIIIMMERDDLSQRPAPNKSVAYTFAMCVLPTTSGRVIELRACVARDSYKMTDILNTMAWPDYTNSVNPDRCTLLPAYVGVSKGLFEIPNCYVVLNATYTPNTKLVDETGTKWLTLGGSLLYKLPTTD